MNDGTTLSYPLPTSVRAFSTTRAFFSSEEALHPTRERCVQLLQQTLGIPAVIAHQQHTDVVRRIDQPLPPDQLPGVDALITDQPGICLCATTADCIPVLLFDPVRPAIAAVHAGWKGTLRRIVAKTVHAMHDAYGTRPEDVYAVIGPGICSDCYEVGDDLYEAFAGEGFPMQDIATKYVARWHLDLPAANRLTLLGAGVPLGHIHLTNICTYTDTNYYSYRREGPHTGRNLNAIILNP